MEVISPEVIPTLRSAVEVVMDPAVSQEQRLEALKVCEDFKESASSNQCIICGLALAQKSYSPIIQHFGLQLIEHAVKLRWNSMTTEAKESLKQAALRLITEGLSDKQDEAQHIKDGISRIIVEIIKREWPQLWVSLLKDLGDICEHGAIQTEVVMWVFLRLVEDVIAFQNIPAQRRREILQTLTANMTEMFQFLRGLLSKHTTLYKELKSSTDPDVHHTAMAHCRVSESVLRCLCGFVDWVAMQHLLEDNTMILQLLCLLLSEDRLQLAAAECLLLIVSRKGHLEDRKPLLILFSKDAMATMLTAAVSSAKAPLDEYNYLFLKRLCQVITEMGKQLATLLGSCEDVTKPASFQEYLQAVLAFTSHASQRLSSQTHSLWAAFLKHDILSKDEVLLSFIPSLIEITAKNLMKVGFPSQNNSLSCEYARLDFDSDEEFNTFFCKYRTEMAASVRLSCLLRPDCLFTYAVQWMKRLLDKPIDTTSAVTDSGHYYLSSPSFLEWDAMTVFVESVISRLSVAPGYQLQVEEGIALLHAVLAFDTQDPRILSCLLSCISCLFEFLTHTPDTLPIVLDKIFSLVVFSLEGQTKATRSKAVKNVRRHACSVLVKTCKKYPNLLLPAFDQLYSHIKSLSSDPDQLSQMEKCTLQEALVLISNKFQSFEKQSLFIQEILEPVTQLWLSDEFKRALCSSSTFISYVGLDQTAVEPSTDDTCGINRSRISLCVHTILSVMKRSSWPDDAQAAEHGGFVSDRTSSGAPILRNPATGHIVGLLENFFDLLKKLNSLWLSENLKLLHEDFTKAYDLQETDKLVVLGIQPPLIDNMDSPVCKQPLNRMQNFIADIHGNSFHILGNAGQCLGYEFYTTPNLANMLLSSAFSNLDYIPDYRLRIAIRSFIKPFIQSCPPDCHESTVIPLLQYFCPYILQRLDTKWQQINQRYANSPDAEDNLEAQEILEDQLNRQLTREYMDLLAVCLTKRSSNNNAVDPSGSEETMMEEIEITPPQPNQREETLSDLGQAIIRHESIYPSVVLCLFGGLSWKDTTTCNKCSLLGTPVVKQLVAEGRIDVQSALYLLLSVLKGLQLHGQHDQLQTCLISLALMVYETLRPKFPSIREILLQVPDCKPESLKSFDEFLLNPTPQKQLSDKKKRDTFKKLIISIIGKNIGECFKHDIHIENLPPIYRARPVRPKLDEVEDNDLGLCALFHPETNGTA